MGPKPRLIAACWAALTFIVIAALPAEAALLPNGGFETGSFQDWTTAASEDGDWFIYGAGDDTPLFGNNIPDPPQGNFAAVSDSEEPSHKVLYQQVTLPNRAMRLAFTTAWRQQNLDDEDEKIGFCTPDSLDHTLDCNQQFRVDVMEVGSGATSTAVEDVLKTVYVTAENAPDKKAPFTVRSSLKAFKGQTVVIRFAQVDNRAPLNVIVDRVKLERI